MSTAPPRTTTRGTPCPASWNDAWVVQVEAREQAHARRICGARTIGGTPCPLLSDHPSGRCRHHGGFALTGAPADNRNAVVHGLYSRRLMICGTHCPAWQSCPMGGGAPDHGRALSQLALAERPQCTFELTEYNAVVTDAMHRACANPDNAFGLHLAHQIALLTVMVSRAARALAIKPFTEKMEQSAEDYYMSVDKPSASLVAFEKLSRELRRWIAMLDQHYGSHNIAKPTAREHELRQQIDTAPDPDGLASLDLTHALAQKEHTRQTAAREAQFDQIDRQIVDSLFARFKIKPQNPLTTENTEGTEKVKNNQLRTDDG